MRHALCRRVVSKEGISHNSKAGFTLLEIVIAVTILAAVFTGLYSAFSSTLETTEAVESERDVEQAARLGLMRMADDLASVYFKEVASGSEASPYRFEGGDTEALDQGGTVLEFATSGRLDFDMVFPSLRINRVSYALEADPVSGSYYRLVRREIPFPSLGGKGKETVIEVGEEVEGLTLTYVDEEGQVRSQWDSEASEGDVFLPSMVHIRLQLAGDKSRFFATTVALPKASTGSMGEVSRQRLG
jgi:type II secretion system protein J